MKKTLAVYRDEHFTSQSPFGARTVIVHTKVGEDTIEVPQEVSDEMDKHFFFNCDAYCEGIGHILARDESTGQIYPQNAKFLFPEGIKTMIEAMPVFQQRLEQHCEELQRMQKERVSKIQTATEGDLKIIDNIAHQGKIEMP